MAIGDEVQDYFKQMMAAEEVYEDISAILRLGYGIVVFGINGGKGAKLTICKGIDERSAEVFDREIPGFHPDMKLNEGIRYVRIEVERLSREATAVPPGVGDAGAGVGAAPGLRKPDGQRVRGEGVDHRENLAGKEDEEGAR